MFSPILGSSQYYQSIEIRESVLLVRELSSVVIHNVNVHITVGKVGISSSSLSSDPSLSNILIVFCIQL